MAGMQYGPAVRHLSSTCIIFLSSVYIGSTYVYVQYSGKALSGAHTIGQAQCQNFRDRLYNETNISSGFATSLKANCPRATGSPGDSNLAPLDPTTPYSFDNVYYSNLKAQKGLLHPDQVLYAGGNGSADNIVNNFASSPSAFSSAFASAMVKMSNLSPLTGSQGQVRITCSTVN